MLMALIKRVDDYLAFAEYDARANWAPMQMAAGINIRKDREDLSSHAAATAANQNAQEIAERTGSLQPFGQPAHFCTPGQVC